MKYKKLGRTGLDVSVIAMGSWVMGGGAWWGSDHDDQRYVDTIKYAMDHGINIIDTAVGYGDGHAEELVRRAVGSDRDKVYIVSKANADALTTQNAENTVDDSLRRLGTDYIDIYFIHWPQPGISVAHNMDALEMLRRKGKIRFIGVSNFTAAHMDIARTAGNIDVFQPPYSLFWRNIEQELLPYCIRNEIGVMTYSSIAMGLLSGKYTKDTTLEDGDIRKTMVPLFTGNTYQKALEAVEKIRAIASRYGSTVAQAALSWVFCQPGISTAVVGARNPAQLGENLNALAFEFSEADITKMGEICESVNQDIADWDTMYFKKADAYKILD
jgi:aryl-alcohol dehydrogenase-like predicted oxidoreductase